jgi:RimJ/RimL family protein N-acetyltransferase
VRQPQLSTDRLLLRRWEEGDLDPFAAMNADPAVTEYLLPPITREQSEQLVARTESSFENRGYGLWAVETKDERSFIGFVGLSFVDPDYPFGPAVEIGWRLGHRFWGHGYATEAARSALAFGFDTLGLAEIVSFTVAGNRRSWAVMERLGMRRDTAGDFDHPRVPEGHPLRPHILYRIGADRAGSAS